MVQQFQFFLDRANIEFDKDLEQKVVQLLKMHHKTIAVAESVTGGLVSAKLSGVPGSSQFFVGGAACYHVRSKIALTGIEPKVIAEHGLVSEATAVGLAAGIRKRLHADLGLGITGVAGPEPHDGAAVGNVFIALADQEKERVQHFILDGSRSEIREKAAMLALKIVTLYFEQNKNK